MGGNLIGKLSAPILVAAAALPVTVSPVIAEDATDPVFVFNRVCYAQVPNIQGIRDMALELAWKPMDSSETKQFTPLENPPVLEGWDAQVGERVYRVGIVQAPPTNLMQGSFPAFADGTATSCTLVLDGKDEAELISANMQKLAGKEPISRDVREGLFLTTTWAGGNDEFRVFLISKVYSSGQGGLLNVTILSKE